MWQCDRFSIHAIWFIILIIEFSFLQEIFLTEIFYLWQHFLFLLAGCMLLQEEQIWEYKYNLYYKTFPHLATILIMWKEFFPVTEIVLLQKKIIQFFADNCSCHSNCCTSAWTSVTGNHLITRNSFTSSQLFLC
jgi:hypothetical protein